MPHCLRVVSLALATLLLVAMAGAQIPAGARAGGTMVATDYYIFVLHRGTLLKFDQKTMALLGRVDLNQLVGGEFAQAEVIEEVPAVEGEQMVEEAETADEAEIVEEIIEDETEPEPAGNKRIRLAVERALEWLKTHQDSDGKWDADAFMKHDITGVPATGPGNPTKDIGVTGLATLAMLGNGSTMRRGPHKDQIKRAIKWLREQQQENGLIGTKASHDFVYSHAIAALAISEAYGLSRYKMLRPSVQKAINYLESHRNPYGVWRYQPRDNDNDTSVTTWALMAYRSAQGFGIDVNENAIKLVGAWYDQVTDPESGRAGYTKRGEMSSRQPGDHSRRFPPENGEAMTAAALFGRFLLDQEPKANSIMKSSAHILAAKPPQWTKGHIDPYYWWFGSQAMFQMGGKHWRNWARGLSGVVSAQRRDGNFAGSWDPVGVWDMDGGRVYSTALHALTLQIPRRLAAIRR